MSQNDPIPTAFLNAGEAVCLLAYGVASENGGEEWRDAELAKDRRRQDAIEQEESDRFFWAKKMLERAVQTGEIHVHGRRSSYSEPEPVPEIDFVTRQIDVIGEDGGDLVGALENSDGSFGLSQRVVNDHQTRWKGLLFKRAEIEELRTAYRFAYPTVAGTTTALIYEGWTDKAIALRSQGATWKEAAIKIAKAHEREVDPAYVERQVRNVRKTRAGKAVK